MTPPVAPNHERPQASTTACDRCRLRDLSVDTGDRVAISGLDQGAAEVLVNLVTGASVPDEGEVLVAGHSTAGDC